MPVLSRSSKLYTRLRSARSRTIVALKRLQSVHKTAYVHPSSRVARDLVAGPYVFIGRDCDIPPLVRIGRYSMLASNVAIVGDDHNWTEVGMPMQFAGRPSQRATVIGTDCWLGRRAIIIRGVTIGNGAIVAAGAVVTKDVPAYEIWAGVPARRLRDRFPDGPAREAHERALDGPVLAPTFVEPLRNCREDDDA